MAGGACGVCQRLAVRLTRYTETASDCLAVSNAVPCHHTDTVSPCIHQSQSCDIPCNSTEHHCGAIDCDLWHQKCASIHCSTHSSDTQPSIYSCLTHGVLQNRLSSVITDSHAHQNCVQCQSKGHHTTDSGN